MPQNIEKIPVIPIQKLVRVQLGSALLAADYAAGRQEQRQAAE